MDGRARAPRLGTHECVSARRQHSRPGQWPSQHEQVKAAACALEGPCCGPICIFSS